VWTKALLSFCSFLYFAFVVIKLDSMHKNDSESKIIKKAKTLQLRVHLHFIFIQQYRKILINTLKLKNKKGLIILADFDVI
jgi:hypothetical protein